MRPAFAGPSVYKDYVSCSLKGFHLNVLSELFDKQFLDACCEEPYAGRAGFKMVNSSRYARVYRFRYGGKDYFYKSYLHRSRFEKVKDAFRGCRAERALRGHMVLRENGFGAPKVAMVGKKGRLCFMVSTAVKNGRGWREHYKSEWNRDLSERDLAMKRETIRELGRTVGRLHSRGIFHGDLRWGNIIIVGSGSDRPGFVFLDNERTVKYRNLPWRKRIKNLVQINLDTYSSVTRTDRIRFLNAYLGLNSMADPDKKKLIKDIVFITGRRLSKRDEGKSGGPAGSENPCAGQTRRKEMLI